MTTRSFTDPSELAAIPGLGNTERVAEIQNHAEETMEVLRHGKLRDLASREEPITERERLLFVRGVGERTMEMLAEAGYRTIEDLAGEQDVDRMVSSTGLGIKKVRQILQGALQFLEKETQIINTLKEEAALEMEKQLAAAQSEETSTGQDDEAEEASAEVVVPSEGEPLRSEVEEGEQG